MPNIEEIKSRTLPRHVCIIMDGNGRWAAKQNKERIYGHSKGVETVRRVVEIAREIGIEVLSLFAFSMENWKRPQAEVNALMELLVTAINNELEDLHKNGIKLVTVGDINILPQKCIEAINHAKNLTANNDKMTLCMAISYSGRWDIVQATKKIAEDVKNNKIKIEDITENLFSKYCSTNPLPDPELLIRTSGEKRISNFFLWQLAYTELYITDKMWPEFTKEDFLMAIDDFQKRERRFGLTSQQIKNNL